MRALFCPSSGMSFRILVMGLSGSGKTTLATKIANILNAEHINADILRKNYNDWDFSCSGRLRQAERINSLSMKSSKEYVVMDFICPLNKGRKLIDADFTIWMDTVKNSKYIDTDDLFETPKNVLTLDILEYNVGEIINKIEDSNQIIE
jgi:adenylylsulfate kinase